MWSVTYRDTEGFEITSDPELLFENPIVEELPGAPRRYGTSSRSSNWDAYDGGFVINRRVVSSNLVERGIRFVKLRFLENWFETLEQLVPK